MKYFFFTFCTQWNHNNAPVQHWQNSVIAVEQKGNTRIQPATPFDIWGTEQKILALLKAKGPISVEKLSITITSFQEVSKEFYELQKPFSVFPN